MGYVYNVNVLKNCFGCLIYSVFIWGSVGKILLERGLILFEDKILMKKRVV